MYTQKLSISLPIQQFSFMEDYQAKHHCKSRSDVIKKALVLLQKIELEACYREANEEFDDAFELTTQDGLDENETW